MEACKYALIGQYKNAVIQVLKEAKLFVRPNPITVLVEFEESVKKHLETLKP